MPEATASRAGIDSGRTWAESNANRIGSASAVGTSAGAGSSRRIDRVLIERVLGASRIAATSRGSGVSPIRYRRTSPASVAFAINASARLAANRLGTRIFTLLWRHISTVLRNASQERLRRFKQI